MLFPHCSHLQGSPGKTNKVGSGLESQELLPLADNTDKQPFIWLQVLGDLSSIPLVRNAMQVFPFLLKQK